MNEPSHPLVDRVTALVDQLRRRGMEVRVTGPRYPAVAFEGGGFTQGRAARIDGGLVVGLTSCSSPAA